jgi:hypothetical protein
MQTKLTKEEFTAKWKEAKLKLRIQKAHLKNDIDALLIARFDRYHKVNGYKK